MRVLVACKTLSGQIFTSLCHEILLQTDEITSKSSETLTSEEICEDLGYCDFVSS